MPTRLGRAEVAELVRGSRAARSPRRRGTSSRRSTAEPAPAPRGATLAGLGVRRVQVARSGRTGRAGTRPSVDSITRAMPANDSSPSRKACTATSLAAFSTQGAVPPASAGLARQPQAGERVRVGRLERQLAELGEVERRAPARRRARGGAARRRSARACRGSRGGPARRRRSGGPAACTIDCGCTTTSMRS